MSTGAGDVGRVGVVPAHVWYARSAPAVAVRKSASRCRASGASGAPDSPPVSLALPDRSAGREIVVFATISASMRLSIAARAISSIVSGSRSGATLRNSGARAASCASRRAASQAANRSRSAAPCCRSRSPGVLGELMLIVT